MTILSITQTLRNTQKDTLNLFHIYASGCTFTFEMYICAPSGDDIRLFSRGTVYCSSMTQLYIRLLNCNNIVAAEP